MKDSAMKFEVRSRGTGPARTTGERRSSLALRSSVGALLAVAAVACGGGYDHEALPQLPPDAEDEGDELPATNAPPATDDMQDSIPAGGQSANDPTSTALPPAGGAGLATDPNGVPTPLQEQVTAMLVLNCSQCHNQAVVNGGLGAVDDLRGMVDSGKLIPGNAEESRIYRRMLEGTMPPRSATQRPSPGDIALLAELIDTLLPIGECAPTDFLSSDAVQELILSDVLSHDPGERPFLRYFSAAYSSNAGACGLELQRQRYALFKMVNSVSLNPVVRQPWAVDPEHLVYGIDMRHYDWDRPIDLDDDGIVDFDDGWQAILDAVGPYALELGGPEADLVKAEAEVAVPLLPINAFVEQVTTGDLYYALIGGRQNINDTERELGIDEQDNVDRGQYYRAAFQASGVSSQDRAVTRQEIGIYAGSYWISQDLADGPSDSMFSNPLDFAFNGGEAIYNLPNGMQAYYATNDDGDRVSDVPVNIVIDPAQANGVVNNAASCHSCHNGGMIPFRDAVRSFVEANPTLYDATTFDAVQEQYLPRAEFNVYIEADSERHLAAVERAGVPRGTADAISRVFVDFRLRDLTLAQVAGELSVEPSVLETNVARLDPAFEVLRSGLGLERAAFTAAFLESMCTLHSSDRNAPVGCLE